MDLFDINMAECTTPTLDSKQGETPFVFSVDNHRGLALSVPSPANGSHGVLALTPNPETPRFDFSSFPETPLSTPNALGDLSFFPSLPDDDDALVDSSSSSCADDELLQSLLAGKDVGDLAAPSWSTDWSFGDISTLAQLECGNHTNADKGETLSLQKPSSSRSARPASSKQNPLLKSIPAILRAAQQAKKQQCSTSIQDAIPVASASIRTLKTLFSAKKTKVYSKEERAEKIRRYREKKLRSRPGRRVIYETRQKFAEARPRVGGRFVKVDASSPTTIHHEEPIAVPTTSTKIALVQTAAFSALLAAEE